MILVNETCEVSSGCISEERGDSVGWRQRQQKFLFQYPKVFRGKSVVFSERVLRSFQIRGKKQSFFPILI